MAQTKEGALKARARKAGVSAEVCVSREAAGEKWCYACDTWKGVEAFGQDRSRYDGLTPRCCDCRNARQQELHEPNPDPGPFGPPPAPPRAGDKGQAKRRVNVLVRTGRWPRPNDLPCADCGHIWREGERRHEYDHYKGYASEHHETVEAVCTTCHKRRHKERG
jgi:hypothetical protein